MMKTKTLSILVVLMTLSISALGEETSAMKIKISAGNTVLTATMFDNATSRDFMSLLPMNLTLKDYAGTEKVSDLPRKLSTEGSPPGHDPSVGDITLYAPWGNLAIFYNDFGYASGLVLIGRIESGLDMLSQISGEATFASME